MLGQFKSWRPPKNFNLLYLESNEVYFMSLKASLLIDANSEQVQGKLHLCSRSIFFEHKNIAKPIIRMKFSSGIILRMMKNIDFKKAFKLAGMRKNQTQLKNLFGKGALAISDMLEKDENEQMHRHKNIESILTKLFQPLKKKVEMDDKIGNCMFIKVPKILAIYRKPISPYITEKVEQNLVFHLNKSCPKNKVLRFLKIYDEMTKCTDQDVKKNIMQKLIQSIVTATMQESAEQLLETHQDQKLDAFSIIKCKRVKIQGCEYGQIVLLKNRIIYYPLLNCPHHEQLEITYVEIKHMLRYRYLFEDKGVQIWLYNYPYSILFVFSDHQTRQLMYRGLKDKAQKLIELNLADISKRWSQGEITNIEYVNYLNVLANRSHNDLSQYPVFPWILHTYDGEFDVKNSQIYRDLTKPIGAINKHRLRKLKDIYEIHSKDKTFTHPPHLYSTHYSTPGYVAYYLIRKIPEFIVRLQNGVFNPSERIFRCIQSAYYSTMNSNADFKELIPEFYSTDCDFLVNSQKLEMGSTPQGEIIDDVILPKWAKNADDFLLKCRTAFQSDYTSSHLHQWIDLIFGFKQSGTSAITSDNIFYYLTYQENVSLDKPLSKMEKAALEVQISEFGQTPVKLFEGRHLTKKTRIIHLEEGITNQDRRMVSGKIIALTEQNERLHEKIERQRYRFNKKLNEKQQILMKYNKEKKKEVQRLKQTLCIDKQSLRKFSFKDNFNSNQEKDIYIRQIEEMIRQRERQNAEMLITIAGMKRQTGHQDNQSVKSYVQENQIPAEGYDFFQDDSHEEIQKSPRRR